MFCLFLKVKVMDYQHFSHNATGCLLLRFMNLNFHTPHDILRYIALLRHLRHVGCQHIELNRLRASTTVQNDKHKTRKPQSTLQYKLHAIYAQAAKY